MLDRVLLSRERQPEKQFMVSKHMQTILNMFGRIVAGPLLIVVGMIMLAGLFLLWRKPAGDIYTAAGIFIGVQAYSVVALLFILVGLRYVLGPRSWIDILAAKSVGRVAGIALLGGLIVGVLWLIAIV